MTRVIPLSLSGVLCGFHAVKCWKYYMGSKRKCLSLAHLLVQPLKALSNWSLSQVSLLQGAVCSVITHTFHFFHFLLHLLNRLFNTFITHYEGSRHLSFCASELFSFDMSTILSFSWNEYVPFTSRSPDDKHLSKDTLKKQTNKQKNTTISRRKEIRKIWAEINGEKMKKKNSKD